MTVAEYLSAGFTAVNHNLQFVLLDMSFKAIWLLLALICFLMAMFLFAGSAVIHQEDVTSLQSGLSTVAIFSLIRIFLENFHLLGSYIFLALIFATLLWTLQEAFVRAAIVYKDGLGLLRAAISNFFVFFLTGLFARLSTLSAIIFIGTITFGPLLAAPLGEWSGAWGEIRWSVLAGGAVLCALIFALTVITTIIRGHMTEDFGDKIGPLVGIIGSLVALEVSFFAFGAMLTFVATEALSSLGGVVTSLVPIATLALVMSFLQSYLLLVRFASVDIMRGSSSRPLGQETVVSGAGK